MREVGGERAGL